MRESLIFIFLMGFLLSGCGPKETETEKAYKEEVFQEDKAKIEEFEALTENPNAIYF